MTPYLSLILVVGWLVFPLFAVVFLPATPSIADQTPPPTYRGSGR